MSLRVGLFDSGLGGLTVLRQVHAQYPHSPSLYLGDTARVPYGSRSPAEIRQIAAEVVQWLRLQGIDVLVMACNTSNALALDVAVAEAGVPVVGLIDSVAATLDAGCIGVLATPPPPPAAPIAVPFTPATPRPAWWRWAAPPLCR